MSRSKKIWLGIFTLLPVLFIGLYFVLFLGFYMELQMDTLPVDRDNVFGVRFIFMFLSIVLAMLSGFGMMIYYVIHANKSNMTSDNKILWILILVLASGIGNIIYYIVHILEFGKNNKQG